MSLSQILTPVIGLAELSRVQIKASTSVTATAMLNAFIFRGEGFKWFSYQILWRLELMGLFSHGCQVTEEHHNIFNLVVSSSDGWWLSGQVDFCRSFGDPCQLFRVLPLSDGWACRALRYLYTVALSVASSLREAQPIPGSSYLTPLGKFWPPRFSSSRCCNTGGNSLIYFWLWAPLSVQQYQINYELSN